MNYCDMPLIAIISLADEVDDQFRESARTIGWQIARNHGIVITYGSSDLSHCAVLGAHSERGLAIGFSSAGNRKEHQERKLHDRPFVLLFVGQERSRQKEIITASAHAGIYLAGKEKSVDNEIFSLYSNKPYLFDVTGFLVVPDSDFDLSIFNKKELQNKVVLIEHDPVKLAQLIFRKLSDLKHAGSKKS